MAIGNTDKTLGWLDSMYEGLEAQHNALKCADGAVKLVRTLVSVK